MDKTDKKRAERSTKAVEKAQAEWYEWLDENMHPIVAREAKAYTETYIEEYWKEQGMKYKPNELKQVTTVKERKDRAKAYKSGKPYSPKLTDDDYIELAVRMTPKEKYDLAYDIPYKFTKEQAQSVVEKLNAWAKEN